MTYAFLSDAWFTKVDEMVAAAGDLQIPPAMAAADLNITVTSPDGDVPLHLQNGLFTRGHKPETTTKLTLSADVARKIFVDGDAAAGVQAFLGGQIQVEGDLTKLVAMQTVEPSEPQRRLTQAIAAVTK